jgi:hypothetical protein
LFINAEEDISFQMAANEFVRLVISAVCDCLINEFRKNIGIGTFVD